MAKNNQGQGGKGMNEQQFFQNYADNIQQRYQQNEIENQANQMRPQSPEIPLPMQDWRARPMNGQARQYFNQQKQFCQMCKGEGLGQTGDAAKDEWELRWGIHSACAHAVWDQLDRASNMSSQRR